MKKIISTLLLIFFLSTNSCFAFSELYYFKNVKTSEIEPLVNMSLSAQDFIVVKQNPYYAVSQSGDDYAVIILQQSGENMFYYYQAEKNTKINKAVLKEVKRQNIICEQSFNTGIIGVYDNLAQNLVSASGAEKLYGFEDEPVVIAPKTLEPEVNTPQVLSGYVAQLGTGTKISAYLQNAINTSEASTGDRIVAVVSDNLVYNGAVVIPQGSLIYGVLSKARNAAYGSRNGRVVIDFNQVVTPESQVYNISTEAIDFTVSNEGKVSESVKNAASTAAAGALLGLVFGLVTDKNPLTSAAVGAGVGAGSSIIYSTAEKGVDAEIPSFTELEIVLTQPLSVNISR